MTNYERTAAWLVACGKTPCPAHLSIQIGCDIEEQAEFLQCLEFDSELDGTHMLAIIEGLQIIASALKRGLVQAKIRDHLREEALDAICDREVTGNGVAHLAGFDKDGADQAVLASNDAKLVDGKPVLLPGGKIGKPEGWKAPSLEAFV